MEKGLKINHRDFINLKNKPDKHKNYEWLYIGTEFCDNLLEFYLKNIDIIKYIPNKVCFLTPPLTDLRIPTIKKLLLKLNKYKNVEEISINDLSILKMRNVVEKNINIGRYLSRFFTRSLVFNNSIKIVKNYAIKRIELTYIFTKIKTHYIENISEKNFLYTIYFPFLNLTTTMGCITGIDEIKKSEDISYKKCNFDCIDNTWKINLANKEELIINGNTVFKKYENNYKKIKEKIEKYNSYGFKADRIVEIRY
jgi:hypothetical protein